MVKYGILNSLHSLNTGKQSNLLGDDEFQKHMSYVFPKTNKQQQKMKHNIDYEINWSSLSLNE